MVGRNDVLFPKTGECIGCRRKGDGLNDQRRNPGRVTARKDAPQTLGRFLEMADLKVASGHGWRGEPHGSFETG